MSLQPCIQDILDPCIKNALGFNEGGSGTSSNMITEGGSNIVTEGGDQIVTEN